MNVYPHFSKLSYLFVTGTSCIHYCDESPRCMKKFKTNTSLALWWMLKYEWPLHGNAFSESLKIYFFTRHAFTTHLQSTKLPYNWVEYEEVWNIPLLFKCMFSDSPVSLHRLSELCFLWSVQALPFELKLKSILWFGSQRLSNDLDASFLWWGMD